ncbi:MAG: glycosyltransferase family protein [Candidatus Wildermuthbacteria bacterium]|nr:glycosyltransferase family protein [Candidatus Wildermuthbacteria bacterium]
MEKSSAIGVIIQARMSSTRLPGKVLKILGDKPVVQHVIERSKRIPSCQKVILATTTKPIDDDLERLGKSLGISVYRGSENDVLDRYYQAAKQFEVDTIVRITADCPCLEPLIVQEVIDLYNKSEYDHVSNAQPPSLPDGLDAEIFSFRILEKTWKEADDPLEREHVSLYMVRHPELFSHGNYVHPQDFSYLRLTLDEEVDFFLLREVFNELYPNNPEFGLREIVQLFERRPELAKINQHIVPHPVSRWKKGQTESA